MSHIRERYGSSGLIVPVAVESQEEAEFIGKALKKIKENRAAKRDDKQQFKLDKIAARGAARAETAAAGGGIGNALKGLASGIGGALGLGGGSGASDAMAPMADGSGMAPPAPPSNTKFIVIGLIVLVVVVGVVMFIKSRKKKS